MSEGEWRKIDDGIVGTTLTHRFKLYQDGEPVDLTALSLDARSVPDGSTSYVAPTIAMVDPQVGDDRGRFTVTHSDVQAATEGDWKMTIRIGPSAGTIERVERCKFSLRGKVTHA